MREETPSPIDLEALSKRFSTGAREFTSSPLYQRLCEATAADQELLTIAAACRSGQQPTNLFLAAVHFLLLGGVQHELAAFYPSLAGEAARSPEGVEPVVADFCREHRDALVETVSTRLVQTNVVNRSAALRLGLAVLAERTQEPITLLEVGCSAGVHLCFDRYAYELGGRRWGMAGSPVLITTEWRGEHPPPDLDRLPPIAARLGVDLHPIDTSDPVERRWLRALVWPENGHEAALLERALAVVATAPPPMLVGDAISLLPRAAREIPTGQPVVVFHASTRAHVPPPLRERFDESIAALGRDRPLFWLSLEAPLFPDARVPAGMPLPVLALRRIDGERRTTEHLALLEGHADWIQPLDL